MDRNRSFILNMSGPDRLILSNLIINYNYHKLVPSLEIIMSQIE